MTEQQDGYPTFAELLAVFEGAESNTSIDITGKRRQVIREALRIAMNVSQMTLCPEYQAAIVEHDLAIKVFRRAQNAYRAREIDTRKFTIAQQVYQIATARFDEAFKRDEEKDYLQKMLADARRDLLHASANLAAVRSDTTVDSDGIEPAIRIRLAESIVLKALDRAWEVQCMCGGRNVKI